MRRSDRDGAWRGGGTGEGEEGAGTEKRGLGSERGGAGGVSSERAGGASDAFDLGALGFDGARLVLAQSGVGDEEVDL